MSRAAQVISKARPYISAVLAGFAVIVALLAIIQPVLRHEPEYYFGPTYDQTHMIIGLIIIHLIGACVALFFAWGKHINIALTGVIFAIAAPPFMYAMLLHFAFFGACIYGFSTWECPRSFGR